MTQAEAAALLDIAVPTVKFCWMKARLRVQEALGGSPFGEPGGPDSTVIQSGVAPGYRDFEKTPMQADDQIAEWLVLGVEAVRAGNQTTLVLDQLPPELRPAPSRRAATAARLCSDGAGEKHNRPLPAR